MSSWSWSAAPLPIRTGREPRQPSKWSRVSSVRSDEPSTRYMIFRGLEPLAAASAIALSRTHPANLAASSRYPRPARACTVSEPSRIQVNLVPVSLAAGLLGQAESGRRDWRASGVVSEQPECHRRAGDHFPPPAGVGRAAQPSFPVGRRVNRKLRDLGWWHRARLAAHGLQDDSADLTLTQHQRGAEPVPGLLHLRRLRVAGAAFSG